ncbi:lysozyme [Breznakibacter xylanolyticus]|uniref:Lysozyme n=1 Tax=Breznakibacter xylanolyticus TaxID=990 RepID=A0A2W7NIU6_9BACT|nr:GH25 family lysozyme [Breznakibacter xylanolyticus]PZX18047.1 lysozyme [Breznakibacter xylanolyticus]
MAKKGKNAWRWSLVAVVAIAAFVVVRVWVMPPRYPVGASAYEVFGVDVSKHSGKIDWGKLKSNGVDFAYIKATEGIDYVDPLYKKNYKALREQGLLFGAYHFFRFCKDGRQQALHFIKHARLQKGDLVPVVDVETWGNTLCTRSDKEVRTEIGKFLNTIKDELGVVPIIYTNGESHRRFIKDIYDGYPLWFCDIDEEPTGNAARWVMWQYSHRGRIEGARHEIDFNVYRRTKTDLVNRHTMR